MTSTPRTLSIHDRHAHKILETYHQGLGISEPGPFLPEPVSHTRVGEDAAAALNVGIVGAGAAGLYTAMILQSLGISYQILEGDNRVGGRLFTHNFSSEPNDYYDVGAMRFPEIPIMRRTFDLFQRLKFDEKILIPYKMSTLNDVELFNGYLVTGSPPGDPFHVSCSDGGTVPDEYVAKGYQHWIDAKFSPFKEELVENFDKGWKKLMHVDKYSTRAYMSLVSSEYPDAVIDWCETMDSATGLYDLAFSESIMDSLDFDWPGPDEKWTCIQGGAQGIATAMAATLHPDAQPIFEKRVKGISLSPSASQINVVVTGETAPRTYSHVVSTMPLSCLRMVDTEGCNLSYALKAALRQLHYDASVKVAIKFTDRWWEPQHEGGVSTTDRPTRVVVYPSYGIGGDAGTMICSYTWSQDALRMGALVQGPCSSAEKHLVQLILKDLAAMHGTTYEALNHKMVDHHAWNWYDHEFSVGAFALFGPGQFRNLYPEVTKPAAGGLLHFAGEATSVHHAWVVGALNSAYRCVMEILVHEKLTDLQDKMRKIWGHSDELRQDLLEKQVLLGRTGYANKLSA